MPYRIIFASILAIVLSGCKAPSDNGKIWLSYGTASIDYSRTDATAFLHTYYGTEKTFTPHPRTVSAIRPHMLRLWRMAGKLPLTNENIGAVIEQDHFAPFECVSNGQGSTHRPRGVAIWEADDRLLYLDSDCSSRRAKKALRSMQQIEHLLRSDPNAPVLE